MNIYLRVIVLSCVYSFVSGLKCLYCDNAANIGECLVRTAVCQDSTEDCYLEVSILPDLTRVFTAGCRSKTICNILSSIPGKRENDLSRGKKAAIACVQCCRTNPDSNGIPCNGVLCNQSKHNTDKSTVIPCNEVLCNQSKYNNPDNSAGIPCNWVLYNQKPTTSITKTCAICDRTANYSTCAVVQQCPANEVCSSTMVISGGSLVYELGCEQKTMCDRILKGFKDTAIGKRDHGDIEICAACCNARNCNKISNCISLRKKQPCFNHSICGN